MVSADLSASPAATAAGSSKEGTMMKHAKIRSLSGALLLAGLPLLRPSADPPQGDYSCHYVQNPLHAIKRLLAGHMPDLIISDIRMPEMRGDEFLEYLKHNELFKQIPVVMLSSEDSTSERIRLLEEGAEDYIVKPFNPQELKIRIKKILD